MISKKLKKQIEDYNKWAKLYNKRANPKYDYEPIYSINDNFYKEILFCLVIDQSDWSYTTAGSGFFGYVERKKWIQFEVQGFPFKIDIKNIPDEYITYD